MLRRENDELNRLFLDVDVQVGRRKREFPDCLFWIPSWWIDWRPGEVLELVEMDAVRLMRMFPMLGRTALIYRSSWKGFHVIFPEARLRWRDVEAIQMASLCCSSGYRFFCSLIRDETLRVSGKKGVGEPRLVKVVRVP